MEKKNKWNGTCYTCMNGTMREIDDRHTISCSIAFDETSFLEVKQYCCENPTIGRPKFHFRIPNIHEKYQECRYYKKLGETQETQKLGNDLQLFCALNLVERLENFIFINSEEKRNLIETFTDVLTKTYAII